MTRIRFDIRYDGRPFHGWARQPGLPTVQGALETALTVLFRQPVTLTVAGRTDAGVHATGQVAHFDLPDQFSGDWLRDAHDTDFAASLGAIVAASNPPGIANFQLSTGLHRRLDSVLRLVTSGNTPTIPGLNLDDQPIYPPEANGAIVVTAARPVPDAFDARFSAFARHYEYLVIDEPTARNPLTRNTCWWYGAPLDVARMHEASAGLLGTHDFAAFCKPREGATTIRTLKQLGVSRLAPGEIRFDVAADAFCHSMVRSLVGALTEVGRGKRDADWLEQALHSAVRIPEIPLAPAQGLTLVRVDYPQAPHELAARQKETRQLRVLAGLGTGCLENQLGKLG